MAGTYVYKPPVNPVTYDMPQFHTPYIHTPRSRTPFIPDSPMNPASPYSRPPSLNPSPNLVAAPLPQFHIPEHYAVPPPRTAYEAGLVWEPRRDRLPLWQDGNQNAWPGVAPPYLTPMDNAGFTPGALPYAQRRRHSFSSVYSPSVQIHPLLNAENPFGNFVFDLASPVPNPLVYYREVPGALSPEGLAQPVTYPPITRMRITSDTLPQEWDVILDLSPELYEYNFRAGYDPPPITVQDVFQELHRHMQSQISHSDWAKLSPRGMEKVRLAFVRRCEAAPGGPDAYDRERAQGVRRVDYLSGKTRFVGLLKTGKEDTFKLITTDPPTA